LVRDAALDARADVRRCVSAPLLRDAIVPRKAGDADTVRRFALSMAHGDGIAALVAERVLSRARGAASRAISTSARRLPTSVAAPVAAVERHVVAAMLVRCARGVIVRCLTCRSGAWMRCARWRCRPIRSRSSTPPPTRRDRRATCTREWLLLLHASYRGERVLIAMCEVRTIVWMMTGSSIKC
jgi:hypothetical protein